MIVALGIVLRPTPAKAECPWYNPLCLVEGAIGWVDDVVFEPMVSALEDIASLTEDILRLDFPAIGEDIAKIAEDVFCSLPGASITAAVGAEVVKQISADECRASIPIDPVTLNYLRLYFKSSFDDVRIHTECDLIGAGTHAITFGNDIYFAKGTYNPMNKTTGVPVRDADVYGGFASLAHELTHVMQYRKMGFTQFACHYATECFFGAFATGGTTSVNCGIEQRAYVFQALVREDLNKDKDGRFTCRIGARPEEEHDWGPDNVLSHDLDQHDCSKDIAECYMQPVSSRKKYCKFIDNCPFDFNPTQLDLDKNGLGDACDPAVPHSACTDNPAANTTVCRIFRPVVTQPMTEYDGKVHTEIFEAISNDQHQNSYGVKLLNVPLKPGDLVTVDATGCVQAGGGGNSWRRYVNPLGDNLLYGVVGVSGALKSDGSVLPNPTRILDLHAQPFRVTTPQNLRLGYLGSPYDKYFNNGYWDHDDGYQGQCAINGPLGPGGDAFVNVLIQHPAPGDVNWDGAINCADLSIVKASFGKKTGQPGFDPRADTNGDGVVDIKDLAFVSIKLPAGSICR